jgi:predicted porin
MRKYLLGTTAVVAATACGGVAYAQDAAEPIKLGLGGYWRGGMATQVGGNGAAQNQRLRDGMQQDSVVNVNGSTKFDNGLSVGVSIQFRGEGANSKTTTVQANSTTGLSSADTVKRSYVRFFGGFGEVRFGDDEDSRLQKAIDAPQAGSLFGVNSPFLFWSNNPIGTNTTQGPIGTKRAQRIAYFSPTFAGFSFAGSFSMNDKKGNLPGNAFQSTSGAGVAGQQNNQYSVAGGYDNKFGDFRIQGSVGYTRTTQAAGSLPITNSTCNLATPGNPACVTGAATPHNRWAWDGGLNLGWGPLTVGGSYEHQGGDSGSNGGNRSNTFDLGVLWTIGPFSTSLGWSEGRYNDFAGEATAKLDIFQVIFDYVLGPGVSIGAAFSYNKYRSGVGSASSVASQSTHDENIALGTAFTF